MSLKETRPIPFRSRARRRSAEGCAIKKPKLWGGKRKNPKLGDNWNGRRISFVRKTKRSLSPSLRHRSEKRVTKINNFLLGASFN